MRELPSTKEYEAYDLSLTLDKRFLFKNGKFAPFALVDVVEINYLYHFENYSVSELSNEFGISFDVIKRILHRYQKGDFDKFINDDRLLRNKSYAGNADCMGRFENFLKEKSQEFASLTMKGYDIDKSCKIANLDVDEAESWLLKGERGIEPYAVFYNDFFKAKEILVGEKTHVIIESIESGQSLEKASQLADLPINEVNMWIEKGRMKIQPYEMFYNEYSIALKKLGKRRIENFLNLIKNGKELNVAAIQSDLDVGDVKDWIKMGKDDKAPYNQFYKEYIRSRHENIKGKLNIFLEKTEEGKAINQSAFEADLDDEEIRTWLNYGKEGIEPYDEFYQDYMRALNK